MTYFNDLEFKVAKFVAKLPWTSKLTKSHIEFAEISRSRDRVWLRETTRKPTDASLTLKSTSLHFGINLPLAHVLEDDIRRLFPDKERMEKITYEKRFTSDIGFIARQGGFRFLDTVIDKDIPPEVDYIGILIEKKLESYFSLIFEIAWNSKVSEVLENIQSQERNPQVIFGRPIFSRKWLRRIGVINSQDDQQKAILNQIEKNENKVEDYLRKKFESLSEIKKITTLEMWVVKVSKMDEFFLNIKNNQSYHWWLSSYGFDSRASDYFRFQNKYFSWRGRGYGGNKIGFRIAYVLSDEKELNEDRDFHWDFHWTIAPYLLLLGWGQRCLQEYREKAEKVIVDYHRFKNIKLGNAFKRYQSLVFTSNTVSKIFDEFRKYHKFIYTNSAHLDKYIKVNKFGKYKLAKQFHDSTQEMFESILKEARKLESEYKLVLDLLNTKFNYRIQISISILTICAIVFAYFGSFKSVNEVISNIISYVDNFAKPYLDK